MIENEGMSDIVQFLEELIKREEIKDAALGIAKQVISKGVDSMSVKQRQVLDNFIDHYKKHVECDRCSNDNVSNLMDYIFIKDSEFGLCPMCEYDRERLMEE